MDKKEFSKKLGRNIRNQRELKMLMQEELANKLNVSPACISSWENGRTEPKYAMLLKIANVLGCDANDLLPVRPANAEHHVLSVPSMGNSKLIEINLGEIKDDEAEMIKAYREADQKSKMLAYAELIRGALK